MKPMSVTGKIVVLLVCALVFGASMVALSVRRHGASAEEKSATWGAQQDIEKAFTVQPGGKLVINADMGDVSVVGTEKGEVSVRVAARGSERELGRYNVEFAQEGDVVRIDGRLNRNHFLNCDSYSLDVRYEIQVPREFNLNLETAGGNIEIHDVRGTAEGSTSGGDIDLAMLEGKVNLSTSGGNVRAQRSSGEFRLETSGGNITADELSGGVHLETSGGNIEIRNSDGKVYASTSGGDIRAAMKENKGIDLSTSGGNLVVRLPRSTAADLKAEASEGEIECGFPFSGTSHEGRMNGKINGGGSLIKLETSGGNIVVNALD